MHDVTIRTLPPLSLALLPHRGTYDTIGNAFDRLQAWGSARGLLRPDTRWFGVFHDDPAATPTDALRSEAGFSAPDGAAGDDGIAIRLFPACRVAALRFRGPYAEIEPAYAWLYGTWLPTSGEEPADAPGLEEYLNDPRNTPPAELLTDILLPLR